MLDCCPFASEPEVAPLWLRSQNFICKIKQHAFGTLCNTYSELSLKIVRMKFESIIDLNIKTNIFSFFLPIVIYVLDQRK